MTTYTDILEYGLTRLLPITVIVCYVLVIAFVVRWREKRRKGAAKVRGAEVREMVSRVRLRRGLARRVVPGKKWGQARRYEGSSRNATRPGVY